MKFEVTQKGVQGIAKGEVIDIDGDKIPAWLVNKGRVVKGKVAVTNPAAADKAATPPAPPKK